MSGYPDRIFREGKMSEAREQNAICPQCATGIPCAKATFTPQEIDAAMQKKDKEIELLKAWKDANDATWIAENKLLAAKLTASVAIADKLAEALRAIEFPVKLDGFAGKYCYYCENHEDRGHIEGCQVDEAVLAYNEWKGKL